jgi:predicted ABC-type transport system involved in lysophospholipase L1 biosynthesis ATPase subunit
MSETNAILVHGHNLVKTYDAGRVRVLAGVDLTVRAGEMVGQEHVALPDRRTRCAGFR